MPDLIDPTRATSPNVKRRTFVSLSATASVAGGTFAQALAQSDVLGRPHPPLVAENDPAISTAHPTLTNGARTLDAYYAAPANAGPSTPGVVLVQAIWGVDAQLRDVARRLAKAGFSAIAPDLYSGLGAPSGDGTTDIAPFRAVAAKLSDDVVDGDLAAAAAFLRHGAGSATQKIGVLGFCMGGTTALRQTVDNAKVFQAAAVFYGKVRYGGSDNANGAIVPFDFAYVDKIGVPLVGSFGARDTSIRADDVRALDAKLTALDKDHDLFIYDAAGHAFFDDTRPSYDPSAAGDAWARTLAWFRKYLK
jgi:carboxymethylenebutenolidase